MDILKKSALTCALALALASCGGGGGGSNDRDDGGDPPDQPSGGNNTPQSQTFLPCINTETIQCSGSTIIETNNSIAMTESGVQVYGKSTSDTDPTRAPGTAWGLAPDSGGTAEIRIEKNAEGDIIRSAMILSNIGIRWDRTKDRPPIVEVFSNQQGRVQLSNEPNRPFQFGPLPPSTDLNFYDYALKGSSGTQENYAANYYFPRSEPIRCDTPDGICQNDYSVIAAEQTPKFNRGPWRTNPNPANIRESSDTYAVKRYHEDGDLRAGDAAPGPNGERNCIECDLFYTGTNRRKNTGFGVSYPGFKGYRDLNNYSFRYANLANWFTQDTVNIVEWTDNVGQEHNKNRRGYVAFGNVTPASSVPTSGTATYRGIVYGTYTDKAIATSSADDAKSFRGIATVTVDFEARTVNVVITQSETYDSEQDPVPSTMNVTTTLGTAGSNKANYFTGTAAYDGGRVLSGGLGGRFFGPVEGNGPAELGGTLLLNNDAGETVIAGFIARK